MQSLTSCACGTEAERQRGSERKREKCTNIHKYILPNNYQTRRGLWIIDIADTQTVPDRQTVRQTDGQTHTHTHTHTHVSQDITTYSGTRCAGKQSFWEFGRVFCACPYVWQFSFPATSRHVSTVGHSFSGPLLEKLQIPLILCSCRHRQCAEDLCSGLRSCLLQDSRGCVQAVVWLRTNLF